VLYFGGQPGDPADGPTRRISFDAGIVTWPCKRCRAGSHSFSSTTGPAHPSRKCLIGKQPSRPNGGRRLSTPRAGYSRRIRLVSIRASGLFAQNQALGRPPLHDPAPPRHQLPSPMIRTDAAGYGPGRLTTSFYPVSLGLENHLAHPHPSGNHGGDSKTRCWSMSFGEIGIDQRSDHLHWPTTRWS